MATSVIATEMDPSSTSVNNEGDQPLQLESLLLSLPREILDEILQLVLFSGASFGQGYTRAGHDRQNDEGKEKKRSPKLPPLLYPEPDICTYVRGIDMTFFQACRQLRDEGERLLYRGVTFDFVSRNWWCSTYSAKMFILELPSRQRQHISHIRFDAWSQRYLPACEWRNVMQLIARECPNLQALQITCPNDSNRKLELSRLTEWIRGVSLARPRFGIMD